MTQVGAYQAKTHLPALLDQVAKGEEITITRHGTPVARLVPVTPTSTVPREETIEQLRDFRQGRKLGRMSLRKMIEQGRRS